MADFDAGFDDFDSTEDFEFDTGSAAPKQLLPEKRLSSPIVNRLCERLLELRELSETRDQLKHHGKRLGRDMTRKERFRLLSSTSPEKFYSSIKKQYMQFAEMLDIFDVEPELLDAVDYPQFFRSAFECRSAIKTDLNTARYTYDIAVNAFCSQLTDTIKPQRIAEIRQTLQIPRVDPYYLHAAAATAQLWSTAVDQYRRCYGDRTHSQKWRKQGNLEFTYGSGYCAIRFYSERDNRQKIVLACYEQLQMIQDATQGRHAIRAALALKLHNGSTNLENHVSTLLSWQDACLAAYGNNGYELVKSPEAVFKSRLNSLTGGDIFEHTSYDRTIEKMAVKERKFADSARYVEIFDRFARRVSDQGDCVELFGLIKVAGHPCVYAEESARSVRKEAMPRGTTSVYYVRMLTRCFKHMVLSGYIAKHGSWPPMSQLPIRDTQLRRHYNNHVTTLPLNSYELSDLDNVEFSKFVEFDYSEDYLKFLDDKAICPGASEVGNFWFGGNRVEPRRLLTKITSMEKFDTRELVERMRFGRTTREEEVVELTQKERELKIAARCFCKLVFAVRSFFTLTEYNLGEHFMRDYCPQQTMTMSDAQVKTRLYSMVRDSKQRNKVMLEVDFSRWNLRWRDDTVRPIARILEDIFGLPGVFTQAHPFFTRATIILTDKHTLPLGARQNTSVHDWPESDLVWRNHLGGFEGIQQKLWSLCTIAMMYICIYDCNVSFLMAGQGDNQIFALTFHSKDKEVVRDQLRNLLVAMEVRCFYLNHEVKPEECIDSATVLTYSKEIYVLGVHKPYSLKFLARTLNVADNDVPSVSRELSGISANAVMCADSLPIPFQGFFWLLLQTLQEASYRLKTPVHQYERRYLHEIFRSSKENASFSLLLPGSLGGLPIQSWGRFFMKGEVDSLSWDVAAVKATLPFHKTLAQDFELLLNGVYKPSSPNLSGLILDPYSIPISRPKDKVRLIKEHISKALPSITKNLWISEIISSQTEIAGKTLLEKLSNTTPLHPKIMHDLYNYSPAGVRDAMLNRFNMTRTIKAVTGNYSFLSEIINGNLQLYRFLLNRMKRAARLKTHPYQTNQTPFQLCARLRSQWGPAIRHQDIGTYTPFDFTILLRHSEEARISVSSRTPVSTLKTEVGPYPPNFGTKTRAKTSDHGFKIITSSSTIGDLRALMITFSELGSTEDMREIIEPILRARSPWGINDLLHIMPTVFGGTAAHRHDTLQQNSFSVLGSKTVPTHLNFCSDKSGILSGGVLDYPLAFQEHYLFLTGIAQLLSSVKTLEEEALCCSILIPNALCSVSTDSVRTDKTVKNDSNALIWPIYSRNALIKVTTLQFKSIPLVPDPNIIRHSSSQRSVSSLIFSSCLTKSKTLPGAYKDLKHAVVHPIDALDISEFMHCNPAHIIEGIAGYVVVESTYQAIRMASRMLTDELHTLMIRISTSVCASLARLFLFDSAAHERYANALGLVMMPGAAGADHVTAKLSGEVVNMALAYTRARSIQNNKFEYIIFEDATKMAHLVLFKLALCWMTTYNGERVMINARDRLQLVVSQARIEGQSRSIVAAEALINSVRVHCTREENSKLNNDINGPNVTYWHTSHDEGMRTLRSLQRITAEVNLPLYQKEMLKHSSNLGQCTIRSTTETGSLLYDGDPVINSKEGQRLEVFVQRLFRPLGRFSTATSVWMVLLPKLLKSLDKTDHAISIGVGHGSIAALLLQQGYNVEGVDLRNSFPRIAQREETYKPSECRILPDSSKFSWHRSVFENGGNIFQTQTHSQIFVEKETIYIIDIEQNAVPLIYLIASLAAGFNIIMRIQCTQNAICALSSVTDIKILRNCSMIRSLPVQNWVLSLCTLGLGVNAINNKRVNVEVQRNFDLKITRSMLTATERINDLIRETGVQVKEATISECDRVSQYLRRISLNSNDHSVAEQFTRISIALENCVKYSRTNNVDEIIHYAAEGDDPDKRVVASYLCLTRPDRHTILERAEAYALI